MQNLLQPLKKKIKTVRKELLKKSYRVTSQYINQKEIRERRLQRLKQSQERQLQKFNKENYRKKGVVTKRKKLLEKQRLEYEKRQARYKDEVTEIVEIEKLEYKIIEDILKELEKENFLRVEKTNTNYQKFKEMFNNFINELKHTLEGTLRDDEMGVLMKDVSNLSSAIDKEKMNNDIYFFDYFKYLAVDKIQDSDLILNILFPSEELRVSFANLNSEIRFKFFLLYERWV